MTLEAHQMTMFFHAVGEIVQETAGPADNRVAFVNSTGHLQ